MWYRGFLLLPNVNNYIIFLDGIAKGKGTLFQCKIYIDHIERYNINLSDRNSFFKVS